MIEYEEFRLELEIFLPTILLDIVYGYFNSGKVLYRYSDNGKLLQFVKEYKWTKIDRETSIKIKKSFDVKNKKLENNYFRLLQKNKKKKYCITDDFYYVVEKINNFFCHKLDCCSIVNKYYRDSIVDSLKYKTNPVEDFMTYKGNIYLLTINSVNVYDTNFKLLRSWGHESFEFHFFVSITGYNSKIYVMKVDTYFSLHGSETNHNLLVFDEIGNLLQNKYIGSGIFNKNIIMNCYENVLYVLFDTFRTRIDIYNIPDFKLISTEYLYKKMGCVRNGGEESFYKIIFIQLIVFIN